MVPGAWILTVLHGGVPALLHAAWFCTGQQACVTATLQTLAILHHCALSGTLEELLSHSPAYLQLCKGQEGKQ